MINQIIKEINKTTKDVYKLDILMDHIINTYLIDKWAFTIRTYFNLSDEINQYLDINTKDNVNVNFIINDNETLSQMINEFKEDIYDLFNPNLILLIDGMTNEQLIELSSVQKEVKNKYLSFNMYSHNILNDISTIKEYLSMLKEELNKLSDNNSIYYCNLIDKLYEVNEYNIDMYMNLYQLFNKTNKLFKENIKLNHIYKEIRFNMIMILAGDKNV